MWSNKYSFIKNEKEKMNGIIDYDKSSSRKKQTFINLYIVRELF